MISTLDPILDDAGLRKLLKFPEDVDLAYYRDRQDLPYTLFKIKGKVNYRYSTEEVMRWFVARQRKPGADD